MCILAHAKRLNLPQGEPESNSCWGQEQTCPFSAVMYHRGAPSCDVLH